MPRERPARITRLLNYDAQSQLDCKYNNEYQICQHHMFYTEPELPSPLDNAIDSGPIVYSVSKRNNTIERELADRGANGEIAGSDWVVINEPLIPRAVNCTRICNHQLIGIPIKRVGAYVESQRGGVICIFHKMAYMGKNKTIISSIQLED